MNERASVIDVTFDHMVLIKSLVTLQTEHLFKVVQFSELHPLERDQ